MQEEVEQKTMALSVRTARLTAELLQKAFRQFFEAQKNKPQEFKQGKGSTAPLSRLTAAIGTAGDVRTSASLRDYLTDDGSRYALWCGQAWLDLATGDAFSLTVYLDSRTGQPLMESAVLYPQDAPRLGLNDMAARLGLTCDLSALTIEPDGDGQKVTVPLSGGFVLVKTISPDGGRFTIRVAEP